MVPKDAAMAVAYSSTSQILPGVADQSVSWVSGFLPEIHYPDGVAPARRGPENINYGTV